jgi:protein-disulfide isomerase
MRPGAENALSWALTAAALAIAVVAVRREFFSGSTVAPQPRILAAKGEVAREPHWQQLVDQGIRTGDADAPIHLVEFLDLECPACRGFHLRTLREARETYGPQLAVTFVHTPLPRHRFARLAAHAAECAGQQSRFYDFVDAIFARHDSLGLKPWTSYAADAGVADVTRFAACLTTAPAARIDSGFALAERFGITGTPTVLVNGWRFPAPPTMPELSRVIDDLLAGREPVAHAGIR